MTETVEEIARTYDMPTWKVAQVMVKLMMRGHFAAPKNTTVEDHAAWLKATYPKPENVIGENVKPKKTPRQRGYDAACRTGEYLGIDRDPECPYPDDTEDSIDWLAGHREGTSAMEYVWSRYD